MDTRVWGDSRFRSLTPIQPCGQGLWFYLLTGPSTTNIPGLYRAGFAQLAEELGWSAEAFAKAWSEVRSQGLADADPKARVIWIPNGIKYNEPESPNVIKSWRVAWDEIPECALKNAAWSRFKTFLEGKPQKKNQPFLKAFLDACPQPLANQEQEQEQEQEQDLGRERGALEDQIDRADQVIQAVFDAKLGLSRPGRSIEDRIRSVLPCPRARVITAVDALTKADIPNWTYFADCFANPLPPRKATQRASQVDVEREVLEWAEKESANAGE